MRRERREQVQPRSIQGFLSSQTLIDFRSSPTYNHIVDVINQASKEMGDVEDIAREVKGDATESSRWQQASELHRMLTDVYNLMDNRYVFIRAAKVAKHVG